MYWEKGVDGTLEQSEEEAGKEGDHEDDKEDERIKGRLIGCGGHRAICDERVWV